MDWWNGNPVDESKGIADTNSVHIGKSIIQPDAPRRHRYAQCHPK